ncbi:hypothetical protein [Aquimarina rhabdastrellae]
MSSKKCTNDLNNFNIFNPVEPMTPKRLKSFEGLEHYSNQQAQELIHQMETIAKAIVSSLRDT